MRRLVRPVRFQMTFILGLAFGAAPAARGAEDAPSAPETTAAQILQASGVQGGLIVHLGSGDGRLTAALRASDRYLVHGLNTSREDVTKARRHVRASGLYGPVSVDVFDGKRLPYVDNLVNLVVTEDLGEVLFEEVMRVLCPSGAAYVKRGGQWTKIVKPRPADIDEWTHYLHDAGGNAVAHDSVIGPPRRSQWIGSPRWARHHDRMASMSALVSSAGRIFYIFDEGPTAAIELPSSPVLIARDAFNGTILWKRPIDGWHTRLWPYKSGPAQLPRRLVAVGDMVYVTLGLHAPLTALDAATGRIIRTYPGSLATEEVIASDGVLFLLVDPAPSDTGYAPRYRCMHEERAWVAGEWTWDERPRHILAVEAGSGRSLWNAERPVVPLTLAADPKGVYFHDGERIVCLDRRTGQQTWRSDPVSRRSPIPAAFGPTLVVYRDVVLFSGGDRKMTSLDALSGKTLWTADHPPSGHYSPEDLLVAGGLVWAGAIAGGRDSGVFTGRDLHTGEIKSEFPPDVDIYWMHHRCHRSKATDRFLLPSRTGIEFVDFRSEHWQTHHWVRGGCIYGIMPANGLVYAPPHSCACYMDAKLNGFYALAPAEKAESGKRKADEPLESLRLERGPAYGQAPIHHSAFSIQHSHDWPAYRHDAARTGRTETPVPAKLKPAWEAALGGRPSSVVVAQGRLYVAEVDAHTVHALDAKSGELVWSFTAGGRVDSPPTIYHRLVLFGSADGWVYCLGAGDGALAWRFRAAPVDRRLVAFEQVESVWPVHGSVLVEGGVLYCVAGRSMFLDGGMRLLRLDPTTGRKLSETVLDDRDPATGENLQTYVTGQNMAAALPDVLSSDGRSVYMRTQSFDLEGTRRHVAPTDVSEQGGEGLHLFSAAGFLDDSWLHRAYWMYGKSIASGANGWFLAGRYVPGGRILAVGDEAVYGFGRKPQYFRWSTPLEYHLFAVDKRPEIVDATTGKPATPGRPEKCQLPGTRLAYRWSGEVPLQARAMVLAGDVLFLAGPPDVVDEEEVFAHGFASEVQPRLEEQVAALEGARGGLLWAVSAADGRRLAEYRLESLPTWDGMAAAAGRLYLSTTDGKVLCLAAR